MARQFQDKLLNFMESGHIKVDQMRKQYDFKIKGAKVFAACNEITTTKTGVFDDISPKTYFANQEIYMTQKRILLVH